jgi:RNA polymerase sigma-70 factor (ECF subfamily)
LLDTYIRTYGKRLYGLCRTLCADSIDADDLYQDTWLRVLNNLERYDENRPFEPWLTRICVNLYRNSLRRISKSPFFNGFSSAEEKQAVLETACAPPTEDYGALHAAVGRLPERLRLAVILFYFRDMDCKAVAQTLNVPIGTVKSRLSKAKKLLKEALKYEIDLPF